MPESNAVISIVRKSFDTAADAIKISDQPLGQIAEGNVFCKTFLETRLATQFFDVYMKKGTAGSPKRSVSFDVIAQARCAIYLYEMSKTTGTGGTTYTPVNVNRNSTKASAYKVIVNKSTMAASIGTTLTKWNTPVGTNVQNYKGLVNDIDWILATTKEYLLRIDPTLNTTGISVMVKWAEDD